MENTNLLWEGGPENSKRIAPAAGPNAATRSAVRRRNAASPDGWCSPCHLRGLHHKSGLRHARSVALSYGTRNAASPDEC
jgi:hypothetical protein